MSWIGTWWLFRGERIIHGIISLALQDSAIVSAARVWGYSNSKKHAARGHTHLTHTSHHAYAETWKQETAGYHALGITRRVDLLTVHVTYIAYDVVTVCIDLQCM